MSDVQSPIPANHPMMLAWGKYKASAEFANTRRWALDEAHVTGSLWASFIAGYQTGVEAAASLHESIAPASDAERGRGAPGAGAMGSVIEYRDAIRRLA